MTEWVRENARSRAGYAGAGVVLGLLLGFLGGYLVRNAQADSLLASIQRSLAPIQESNSGYTLIKPLLGYRTPEATDFGDYTALKSALQNFINQETTNGDSSRVSVYFRNLNTAQWIGIDQSEMYYPASLLKVPVMIAYYKIAETDPAILSEELVYEGGNFGSPFDSTSTLAMGKAYSVNELINQMITNSDNGATYTLLAHMDPTTLSQVYADLGIADPGNDSANYQISTRTYALFFRILYNATYLSPEYSEKALALLSQDTFDEGLSAGTPASVSIAHKWGEHVVSADGKSPTSIELHDCGVVYYKPSPYLLCVMTSAKDLATATTILQTIASTTYNLISTNATNS